MGCSVDDMVRHFESIYRMHMQGLPIVNSKLEVEMVGPRSHQDHQLAVLITPWFMNLVLVPGTEEWADDEQGASIDIELPAGHYDFTLSQDEDLGTYLTAVLFRTVSDFPDQDTAREVAATVLEKLFEQADSSKPDAPAAPKLSRRELFTRLGNP